MKSTLDKLLRKASLNVWQLSKEEYKCILDYLGNVNFLVFGLGNDTELWRFANQNGTTVFLEHDPEWLEDSDDVIQVKYTCKMADWEKLFSELVYGNYTNLHIDLPSTILYRDWDVIFVDSPQGYNDKQIGRMQSIFMAWKLANDKTKVFIHDCDREVEDAFSRQLFLIEHEVKRLRRGIKA